jgi:transposase
MDRDDLIAFARRDWAMVAESKSRFWLERKRRLSVAELLAVGDELRRHAMAVRPDWPTAAERAADLAIHQRVTEALRAVPARPR